MALSTRKIRLLFCMIQDCAFYCFLFAVNLMIQRRVRHN